MSSPLREIIARFGVQVDGAEKVKSLDSGVDKLIGRLQGLGNALVGGAVVVGIRGFAHSLEQAGSELTDASAALGVNTDNLQAWRYAAGQIAGVRGQALDAAFQRLNLSAEAAAQGSKKQANAFKDLGVQALDTAGNMRPMDELLPDLLDGFAGVQNPSERAALAVALFGRAGTKLTPFLALGRKGLAEFTDEFGRLGGGMSKEAVAAADEYGDALGRLDVATLGLKAQIGLGLLPILQSLVDWASKLTAGLKKLAEHTYIFETAAAVLTVTLGRMAAATLIANAPLVAMAVAVASIGIVLEDIVTMFSGGKSVFGALIDDMWGAGTAAAYLQKGLNTLKLAWLGVKALSGTKASGDAFEAERLRQIEAGEARPGAAVDDRQKRATATRNTAGDAQARQAAINAGDIGAFVAHSDPRHRDQAVADFNDFRKGAILSGEVTANDADRKAFGASIEPRGGGRGNRTVSIGGPTISITVPPGSSRENVNEIRRVVEDVIDRDHRRTRAAVSEEHPDA